MSGVCVVWISVRVEEGRRLLLLGSWGVRVFVFFR